MNRASLLQETAAWMDTVDLALCLFIYEVCNDYQFEYLSGSDFVNFLNLKPTGRAVIVRPKENLRICYMELSITRTIRPRERGKLWSVCLWTVLGLSIDIPGTVGRVSWLCRYPPHLSGRSSVSFFSDLGVR